jgi:hypothetical protein
MPLSSPLYDAVYPAVVDLPQHIFGNAWPGFPLVGPAAFPAGSSYTTLHKVRMIFSRELGGGASLVLTSDLEPLEPVENTLYGWIPIIDPVNWVFTIRSASAEDFTLLPGNWAWRILMEGETGPEFDAYRGILTVTL